MISFRNYFICTPIILLFFFITGRTLTYGEAMIMEGFTDIGDYYQIGTNLLNVQELEGITIHKLERWFFHYIAGYTSLLLNIDLWSIYKFIVIMCVSTLVFIINILKCSELNKIAIFIFLLLNPYTFRMYWTAPGMINDCIFFTSITCILVGLIEKRPYLFVSSIIIATLARQTIILCLPIFLILYLNNKLSRNLFIIGSLLIIVFYFGNSQIAKYIFNTYNEVGYVSSHVFNYYDWFIERFSYEEFIAFYGRYALVSILALPLLTLTNRCVISNNKIYLISFFIMQSQPLLITGPLTGGNIQRLCALAIPFLIPLFLLAGEVKRILPFTLLVCFYSMHHIYTIMFMIPNGKNIFALLVFLSGIISLASIFKNKI